MCMTTRYIHHCIGNIFVNLYLSGTGIGHLKEIYLLPRPGRKIGELLTLLNFYVKKKASNLKRERGMIYSVPFLIGKIT